MDHNPCISMDILSISTHIKHITHACDVHNKLRGSDIGVKLIGILQVLVPHAIHDGLGELGGVTLLCHIELLVNNAGLVRLYR